jgi:hypothetical protein
MEGTAVNIRFVPGTSIAAIEKFPQAYKASLVNGQVPGGWYRVRISDSTAAPEELKRVASKMRQEAIVSLAVVADVEEGR